MPGKTREDDFLEKLAELLRAKREGGQPIQPAAAGEGECPSLGVDIAPPNEPCFGEVAAPSPRPAS